MERRVRHAERGRRALLQEVPVRWLKGQADSEQYNNLLEVTRPIVEDARLIPAVIRLAWRGPNGDMTSAQPVWVQGD